MHEATGEKSMKQLINSLWIEIEKKDFTIGTQR